MEVFLFAATPVVFSGLSVYYLLRLRYAAYEAHVHQLVSEIQRLEACLRERPVVIDAPTPAPTTAVVAQPQSPAPAPLAKHDIHTAVGATVSARATLLEQEFERRLEAQKRSLLEHMGAREEDIRARLKAQESAFSARLDALSDKRAVAEDAALRALAINQSLLSTSTSTSTRASSTTQHRASAPGAAEAAAGKGPGEKGQQEELK
jgi:hypothetical protein